MLEPLSNLINSILLFFYDLTGDYGLAIIFLALLVNVITFILTRKQLQSSKKMQEIQPELKKIQDKYKHDKEKQNRATMEFMQKNKVNPLAGCLPLLLQFPIIIAVFQLLRDPANMRAIPGFDPTFLFLPWDLTNTVAEGGYTYYILPVLSAAATFFHQRMILTDPKQKMMLYIFPVMILVISVNFPAGLVLYWFTNSLFSVSNHLVMNIRKKDDNGKKPEVVEETVEVKQENKDGNDDEFMEGKETKESKDEIKEIASENIDSNESKSKKGKKKKKKKKSSGSSGQSSGKKKGAK